MTKNDSARVVVFVSGGGTNLQAIIDAQNSGIITSGRVCKVISNTPSAYALIRAEEAGIPTEIICKKDFPSTEDFENQLIHSVEECGADLIVLAGFMSILSERFTSRFDHKIINVHPSLIPSFCGAGFYGLRVHEAALARGVKVTGATVHYVNEIPDGGEIIAQKAVEILPDDTPEVLQKRVMKQAEWIILPAAIEKICYELSQKKKGQC